MNPERILENVKKAFPSSVTEAESLTKKIITITVRADRIREIASFIKNELGFDVVVSVGGVDEIELKTFQVVYYVWSSSQRMLLMLKTSIPRNKPSVSSLINVWEAVDYHERETFEMFGINFQGHSNLTKLLLPEEWNEGFPLRKDFEFQSEEEE